MTREFRRSILDFRVFVLLLPVWIGALGAQEIPAPIIENLSSEKFSDRETGQKALLEWSRRQPAKSVTELHRQSRDAPDPEVRSRCLAVLKELVIEREYRGEGYLGISMIEVEAVVPGEAKPRRAIRVGMVMPRTAAEAAGIVPNNLIVGLGDKIWNDEGMAMEFAREIRESKPGTMVVLQLLEEGKIIRKKIAVGEKPLDFAPAQDGEERDPVQAAKDRFFERWLDKRNAGAR